jgi:hypothetical protein
VGIPTLFYSTEIWNMLRGSLGIGDGRWDLVKASTAPLLFKPTDFYFSGEMPSVALRFVENHLSLILRYWRFHRGADAMSTHPTPPSHKNGVGKQISNTVNSFSNLSYHLQEVCLIVATMAYIATTNPPNAMPTKARKPSKSKPSRSPVLLQILGILTPTKPANHLRVSIDIVPWIPKFDTRAYLR